MNLHCSGMLDTGYITGVAYSHNCVRKPIKKVKSLYLEVKAEIHKPTPSAKQSVCNNSKGNANKNKFGFILLLEGVKNIKKK